MERTMDQVSQIQSSQFNANSLNQHPYVSGASSLVVGGESLVQVDLARNLEQPILRAIPVAAEVSLSR